MKKLNLFTLMIAGLLALASCEEASVGPKLSLSIEPPSFTSSPSGQSIVLTEDAADDVAIELSWNEPGLGFRTQVDYTVEMAASGTEFADPMIFAETRSTSASATVGELNKMLIDAGFMAEVENSLDFRVTAEINNVEEDYTSETESFLVTPYPAALSLPDFHLYLVGSSTAAGWDNNNNNMAMVRLPDSEENNFTFTGRFVDGEFKLLESLGAWQPQWGNNGGALASSDDLGGDPPSFAITGGDGYYTVDVDIEARSFNIQSYDASSAASYTTIGVIGDATPGGWDSDTDLTQSTFDPHMWYINNISLVDGFAKFRAGDDWANNWGANTEYSGFGTQDGPNIPVTQGTYNIWYNDLTGGYIFIPVQ